MPAVLFYVQHLLGIGHLMRARFVAEALADAGFDVHLVCGGRPVGGRPPTGVRTVQLPPIHATDAGLTPLRDADGVPIDDAFRAKRRDLLLAEFDAIAPAAVVFEAFPFGRRALRFELMPLLDRAASARPRPVIIASVRDILQRQSKAGRDDEILALVQRYFDAVLIHGDRRFASFDDTFPLAPRIRPLLHYTGFVRGPRAPEPVVSESERREIVVSAGGGAVGARLLRTAIAARPRSRLSAHPWRILAGANVASAEIDDLARDAQPGMIVEPARDDFPALLGHALVSVSQAGYNTVLDVMASGARAVLVPYAEHGETEQRARAARLAELGLAHVLDGAELSPDALAAAIDGAAVAGKPPAWEFDSRGAARSAEIIGGMIGAGAARRAAQDPWTLLDAEIDAWHAAGSTPTLWCRDDDACRDTPALRQLFAIAEAHGVPVALAVIPAQLEPNLIGPATTSRVVTVIQHGYAHRNHAGAEERKRELGAHRPRELIAGELARGLGALQSAFGPRFAAALVPPWNRIDPEVIAILPAIGFHGLSTMGPRAAVAPVPGIVQCNAHVDVVAWRDDRQFIGVERAVTRLVRHLRARREGSVDAEEPTGILTHHLVMSGDGWTFLAALMARTRARRVTWLDARAAFAVPGPASVTSGRSA